MSLHNDVANPSEDGGFTKLLAGITIFNRNKKPASALPPFLSKGCPVMNRSNT